jgi:hypothetical protein
MERSAGYVRSGREPLRRLAGIAPVWVAGPGATLDFATATGAQLLDFDPLAAAERVAAAGEA